MATEQIKYDVIQSDQQYEIRQYVKYLMVECDEQDLAGGKGFGLLFNYISGDNDSHQSISMTAPVINNLSSPRMAFVMPSKFDLNSLPLPKGKLNIVEVPPKVMACLRFSGRLDDQIIQQQLSKLRLWIQKKQLTIIGEPILARYNPPFLPGFLKRHEVMFEVRKG
jgi:hypothetical protein